MSTHNQPPHEIDNDGKRGTGEVTFLTILKSVFSSFFGVQSNANRIRDFQSGKFWHFFFAGLIFVAFFIVSIAMLVKYIIATSG